jgi:hypothetical protein
MCANWVLEEAGIPADNGTRRILADSIRLLVRDKGGTTRAAAEFILQAAKQAEATGDVVNRFWFTDRRYNPQRPKKSDRQKRIEEWEPSND